MQDNVLFGRIVDAFAEAVERVSGILRETMDALDLTGPVIELGLAFDIGSGAKRLSLAQQQKLALARALLWSVRYSPCCSAMMWRSSLRLSGDV